MNRAKVGTFIVAGFVLLLSACDGDKGAEPEGEPIENEMSDLQSELNTLMQAAKEYAQECREMGAFLTEKPLDATSQKRKSRGGRANEDQQNMWDNIA